jgi:hypothetical protein
MSALYSWFITYTILFRQESRNDHINTEADRRLLLMKNTRYNEAKIILVFKAQRAFIVLKRRFFFFVLLLLLLLLFFFFFFY